MNFSFQKFTGMQITAMLLSLLAILAFTPTAQSQSNEDCLGCHSDSTLTSSTHRNVFVSEMALARSVHKIFDCLDCHQQEGANFEDVPHFSDYQPVSCARCHTIEGSAWMEYFYKMLQKRGTKDIPNCVECHGAHEAQKQMSMKIVCDRCHLEIANQYRQSYHFQKYQEDARKYPICTTCHDPHFKSKKEVLSEIEYQQEIVDICTKCHQRDVETYVHSRHFHELERGNTKAPVCTSCHERHNIKKPSNPTSQVNSLRISDVCNTCHPGHKESLHRSPGVDPGMISCATCHTGHQTDMASINQAIFKEGGIFNRCNYCHSTERHTKENLAHGKLMLLEPNGQEANCTHCHIYHYKMGGLDGKPIPSTQQACANCHAKENRAYKNSIHGKARAQGITEAPYCTDCHGARDIEKVTEKFTPEGIIKLCSSCHANRELILKFQINPYVVQGYLETYHGKMLEMGNVQAKFAVCTNCHTAHSALPPDDPASSVSRQNIVNTCKQCHPRANDRFVSYLVHPKKPSSQDLEYGLELAKKDTLLSRLKSQESERQRSTGSREPFRKLNAIIAGLMTVLLVSVLGLFGFHTFLWFQRGIRGRFVIRGTYYRRIDPLHRFLHVLVNISFLTLAFTGLPQSYAHTDLAKWLFTHVMTLKTAQTLHYIAAVITGVYFLIHVIFLIVKIRKLGWRAMLTGSNTMVLRWKDLQDFFAHLKWFVGKGPHPQFDRWTYWEKFDYFAVFWGIMVIGLSGLVRLFKEFFGNLIGGGIITLADTIHKEEALLATAFIFIVHFFNTHLRAEKFPMDVSIYTGYISEEEFQRERPLEWERMQRAGKLDELRVKPPSVLRHIVAYAWGISTLSLGLFLLALILIGQFTAR